MTEAPGIFLGLSPVIFWAPGGEMTSICPVWVELVRDPSRWGTISIATNVNEAKSVRGKCLYAVTNLFCL
jgi:hypothetical protein